MLPNRSNRYPPWPPRSLLDPTSLSLSLLIPVGINLYTTTYSLAAITAFMLVCFLVLQHLLHHHNSLNKIFIDYLVVSVLAGAMFCGCITDSIGVYSLVVVFTVGLFVPPAPGPLSQTILHRMEGFVHEIMLAFYFASNSVKADFSKGIFYAGPLVASPGFIANVVSFMIVRSVIFNMPLRDSAAHRVLLINTKGVLPFIILNVGLETMVSNHNKIML